MKIVSEAMYGHYAHIHYTYGHTVGVETIHRHLGGVTVCDIYEGLSVLKKNVGIVVTHIVITDNPRA